ncbi:Aste57867_7895 [Aphanomyces stellatus]|uniref:Aste57867_7895 protein n=1 Tax=Aphanomyces stellatus TaxID=120398 RepID=A0A485KIX9_9STRA|nr:hypothetical protein As57867_007865 [Aphanomyces stellatus]VFT84788.1 Aste57867_7895 [Aphanomyces stellatus]
MIANQAATPDIGDKNNKNPAIQPGRPTISPAIDEFVKNFAQTPATKSFTIDMDIGKRFRQVKEFELRRSILKESFVILWESKFQGMYFTKTSPTTIALTYYDKELMRATIRTALSIGSSEFTAPEYSPHAKLYHITFNNVPEYKTRCELTKKLLELTKCVASSFHPSEDNLLRTTQLRILFDSETPPAALVPTVGSDPLREIKFPTAPGVFHIFQHKLHSLNRTNPSSIQARKDAEAAMKKTDAERKNWRKQSPNRR